ncbi:MAG: hydrolase [Planctomycetota bacterium]|jgi:nicotinamidase-related amidase
MLDRTDTAGILIDLQVKLARVIHQPQALIANCLKLIKGLGALEVPILVTEQNPAGLGPTVPEAAELLAPVEPITKLSFSCCGEPAFVHAVEGLGRKQLLLAGMEAHVCVYQTAADLAAAGYEVQIVADAVSSRDPDNKAAAIRKARSAGAGITTVEMALFELLKVAEGDAFRRIIEIVK